jgi:hypothetical protein
VCVLPRPAESDRMSDVQPCPPEGNWPKPVHVIVALVAALGWIYRPLLDLS